MRTHTLDTTWFRLAVGTLVGALVAGAVAAAGRPDWSAMVGWIAAATAFCTWTWLRLAPLNADATGVHATREDPGRAVGDLVLLAASLAAVVGVGFLLAATARHGGADIEALIGVASVAASWFLVHTMFGVRYARLYYGGAPGGIDFGGDEDPTYVDFAYLAFTIGMTYQVSDTTLQTRAIRHTALRQALLSFALGAVVLACTINLVVQLASAG